MNKRTFAKVIAVCLAIISVFALSMTAFAAGNTLSITVKSGDTHNYSVYQICTGDYSASLGKISNAEWGSSALKSGEVSDADLTALEALANSSAADAEKLNSLVEYVDLSAPVSGTLSVDSPMTGLAEGYYLIKDKDTLPSTDTYSLYIVKMGKDNIEIERKAANEVPSIEKTVDGVKGTDAAIGDKVDFTIKGKPANLTGYYSVYKFAVNDTLDAGLSLITGTPAPKVMAGSVDVTDAFTISAEGQNISFTCSNILTIDGVTKDTEFVFTYSASLNANAVSGTAGNKNNAKLEYSNDPNLNEDGTPNTAETTSQAKVYTYDLIINEVDEKGDPLPGVGLTLEKLVDGSYVPVSPDTTGTTYRWNGLDAGSYRLSETTTPDGYNTMKPKEFTITSTINAAGDLTDLATTLEGATVRLEPGEIEATIANKPGISLPVTGTIGIVLLAGAAAVVTGTAFGIRAKGKKDEEENA